LYEYGKYLKGKNRFRYYCSRCQRTKETTKPVDVCIKCGYKRIHPLANWSLPKKREIFKENGKKIFRRRKSKHVGAKNDFLKKLGLFKEKKEEEELPSWEN
jgi:hypothetical protein